MALKALYTLSMALKALSGFIHTEYGTQGLVLLQLLVITKWTINVYQSLKKGLLNIYMFFPVKTNT